MTHNSLFWVLIFWSTATQEQSKNSVHHLDLPRAHLTRDFKTLGQSQEDNTQITICEQRQILFK